MNKLKEVGLCSDELQKVAQERDELQIKVAQLESQNKELERLTKQNIDNYKIASDIANANNLETKEAKEALDIAVKDVNRLESEIKELKYYVDHNLGCELRDNTKSMWLKVTNESYTVKCSCGLDNLLK